VPNARADNSVTYIGAYKGVTLGAGYSFGRDAGGTGNSPGQGTCTGSVPGHATECRDWSVMLKYDAPYFGLAASYEEERGGATAAANFFDGVAPTPLTNAADKDARTHVSAYAQCSAWAGWADESSPNLPQCPTCARTCSSSALRISSRLRFS
jgi:predicted porin